MTLQSFFILLLGALVVLIGTALMAGIIRRFRRDLGLQKEKPEKNQEVSFIISAFQDVTRQLKEKEKELSRLKTLAEQRADDVESFARNILQCVTNGVITFDRRQQITTANRAAEEILGIADLVGRTCGNVFGDTGICSIVKETADTGKPSARMEATFDRKGELLWLGYNTVSLSDGQGSALGVILSFSDLTEVKRLQEQMELKERLTALGEMSAGIAHELRNPMAVISGYLNLLVKRQDDRGQAVIRDVLTEINGMNRIIGDLLTFARPASLNRSATDMRDLLQSCVSAAVQAREGDPPITTELDLAAAQAAVDEGLMRQALGNIIQNALDAMPAGGALSVSSRVDRYLAIRIADRGVGIPSHAVKNIFLPFFTTKENGVGMGLALAHKIISSHGGRIAVESKEGEGTTFTILLPRG